MPLIFEKQDDIPEPLRGEFEQRKDDGKWQPKGLVPLELYDKAKSKAATVDDYATKLKAWDGLDPESVRSKLSEADKLRRELDAVKAGKPAEELDAMFKERFGEHLKAHEEKIAGYEDKLKAARETIATLSLDTTADAAASRAAGFRTDDAQALADARRFFRDDFKTDDKGQPTHREGKLNAKGEPFGPDDWFEGQRKARPWLFKPSGNGGGAGGAGGGGGAGKKTLTRAEFDAITDPVEKAKAAREATIT